MFTRIGFRMIKPCFGVLNKRMIESKSFGSHKLKKRVNKSTLYVPRMVIKDSRSLAEAMVRMIDDSEIDNHRQILISIRENEDMKKSLYERLLLEQQDSFRLKKAFPWFNEWLLKALSTDRVHLFPLFVPVVANDQLLDAKATLAAYLFAYKHRYPSRFFEYLLTTQPNEDYVEPQKDESTIYAKASIIANDIGDRLHISKIEKLTNLVKNYTEQTSQNQNLKAEQLLADITSLCSIHIDLLYPLLNFLDVAINPTLQTLIDSRSLRRQHITHDLSRELNSIVYNHYHGFSSNTNADEKTSSSDPLQAYYYLIDKNNNRRQIFRSELHDVKDKNIDASIRKENVSFSEQTVQNRDFQQKSFPISFVTVHFLETKVFCSQKFPLSESADALSVETSQRSYMGSSSEWNGEANLRKTADNDDYEQFLKSIQEEEFTNIFDSPPPNNPPPTTTGFQGALVSTATIPPPPSVFRPTSNSSIPIISEDYSAPYRKVLLDNLPNDITEFDLMNALQPCGKVKKIFLYNASTSSTPPEGTTLPKRRRSVVTTTKELTYPIESAETNLNSDIDLLEAEDISMDDVLDYVDSDIIENDTEKPKNIMDEDDDTFVGEDEDEEDTDEDEDFVSSTTDSPQNEESTQKKKKQNRAAGLRKVKKKMAQGDRTDRYAFVVFESDESYFRATRDIFRLFGLILKVCFICLHLNILNNS